MISEIAVTTKTAEGDSYLIESFEGSQIIAKKQGMEIVHSTKERLLLDLDTGAQQDQYRNMLRRLKNIEGNPIMLFKPAAESRL